LLTAQCWSVDIWFPRLPGGDNEAETLGTRNVWCTMTGFYLLLFLIWVFGFAYQMIGLGKSPARLQNWADRHRLRIIERTE
jgi:hypothetical protein